MRCLIELYMATSSYIVTKSINKKGIIVYDTTTGIGMWANNILLGDIIKNLGEDFEDPKTWIKSKEVMLTCLQHAYSNKPVYSKEEIEDFEDAILN